jgi:NAD(P)-dependent dehydrogenase (short-subunit alcohol dehydrogenase family)
VLRFDGRAAIVTGGGRGLGRAYARLLADRGAQVVVNDLGTDLFGDHPDSATAEAVAAEITAAGGRAVANVNSVATTEGANAIVETALRAFGRVDIVINNAGTTGKSPFPELTGERLAATLASHLLGSVAVCQAAWGPMRRQRYGRIVNTTSAVGFFGMDHATAYAAAKMGVFGVTRCLALEGEPLGIRVNGLAPVAETRMARGVYGALGPRLDPDLVAAAAALLAHEDCPFTGRVLTAGGGRVGEIFIGATQGYFDPRLTPEAVRDHLGEVLDPTDFAVPEDAMAEVELTAARYGVTVDGRRE